MGKHRMPRNRVEYEDSLISAFIAGCNHGYATVHEADVHQQEYIGALEWIGRISTEEADKKLKEIRGY